MKTRDVKIGMCIDGSDLTAFIEDNSELEWNDICDIERKINLYGDEGRCIGYIRHYELDTLPSTYTENEFFYLEMINKFYEAYGLDKDEMITILFTD